MTLTLRLTNELAEGLQEILDLAQRGRDEFLDQTKAGGCEPKETEQANAQWEKAKNTIDAIRGQLDRKVSDPVMEAVEEFTAKARDWFEDDIWQKTSCQEAEASAELFKIAGRADDALQVIRTHARSDYEEEDTHHALYLENQAERKNRHAIYG